MLGPSFWRFWMFPSADIVPWPLYDPMHGPGAPYLARFKNFHISIINYNKWTQFTSKYIFLRVANSVKLVKNGLLVIKELKIQDDCQFCLNIVHDTNLIVVQILSNSCLCLYNKFGQKPKKFGDTWPPPQAIFKISAMENAEKAKTGIFITQLLFVTCLRYLPLYIHISI